MLYRRSLLSACLAILAAPLCASFRLHATEADGGGAPDPVKPAAPPATPPVVDVDAAVAKALAAERAEFAKTLKEVTGHESLEKLHEHQAKQRGEHEKLLTERTAELERARSELASVRIESALLAAASDAVDPMTVVALLAGRAKYEGNTVSVDGKSPADAVAELLKTKPFLAKAAPAGSGTPAGGGSPAAKTMSREEFDALSHSDRNKFLTGGGKVA